MYFSLTLRSIFFHLIFFSPIEALAHEHGKRVAPVANAQLPHEAVPVLKERQDAPPEATPVPINLVLPSLMLMALTYITPSPSASPIVVTTQSQVVDSYVPIVTYCALPPLAYVSGSWINTATTGPYHNYSVITPTGTGTCETSYSPTQTTVCATTLTGLVTKITVTACEQNVTFSTERGYTVETPSASLRSSNLSIAIATSTPTIRDLTTYYIAPWQSLAATPGVPPLDVDKRICSTYANGSTICEVDYQEWRIVNVTGTTTTVSHIDFVATWPGPGTIYINTAEWNVTETITTFSLSSTMAIASSFETESTSVGPRTTATTTATPAAEPATVTSTLTVVYNTAGTPPESPLSVPWTTTVPVTVTAFAGTSTATVTPAAYSSSVCVYQCD